MILSEQNLKFRKYLNLMNELNRLTFIEHFTQLIILVRIREIILDIMKYLELNGSEYWIFLKCKGCKDRTVFHGNLNFKFIYDKRRNIAY